MQYKTKTHKIHTEMLLSFIKYFQYEAINIKFCYDTSYTQNA